MTELRQDPTTFDWIIIAKNRAKRQHQFKIDEPAGVHAGEYSESCPFCAGNEHMTPDALAVYGEPDHWQVRVVPNKYSALTPDGDMVRQESRLFRKAHGYGRHEVIIETPRHNELIPFMDHSHIEKLINTYKERYHALKTDPNIKIIIIFKNHGEGAGTSLEHPHAQIVASPIVPPYIRRKYEVATQYYDNTGRCLHYDLMQDELEEGTRVVASTDCYGVIHPFASHYPYETWIMPRNRKSSFGDITGDEIKDLVVVLRETLRKLYVGLGNPDYNLVVHTAPIDDEQKSYYLWHLQIIPRTTKAAGFELGSGIFINTELPEETAQYIRDLKLT